jgi:hypothetical protein
MLRTALLVRPHIIEIFSLRDKYKHLWEHDGSFAFLVILLRCPFSTFLLCTAAITFTIPTTFGSLDC